MLEPPEPVPTDPGRWPKLETALAVVNRDLRATLPGQDALVLMGVPSYEPASRAYTGEEQVYVAMPDGRWQGNPVNASDLEEGCPPEPHDPETVLGVVAEAAQDTLMELLRQAWPVCPAHGFGMHLWLAGMPEDGDGSDVSGPPMWHCRGGRGGTWHGVARVGELAAALSGPSAPRAGGS